MAPPSSLPRIGILGAGQLGRMLAEAASPWNLPLRMLDPTPQAPASSLCEDVVLGDFRDYDTVMAFGQDCDVLSIEIEQVNADALADLEAQGKQVHPKPSALKIIQDKGLQKQFYAEQGLPSSPFQLFDSPEALKASNPSLPAVQKTRTDGYDGRGVKILREPSDLENLLPGPCLLEDAVDVEKELAVIAARRPSGEVVCYDPVEMSFHPEANLVEFLLCPARISPELAAEAQALATRCIEAFDLCGLLAVELFLDREGKLLINEVAPRPHNSGHHSIEACICSQYEQMLRCLLDLPLGSSELLRPGVMMNLLGAEGHSGPAKVQGLEELMACPGAYLHLYGKAETRPFRKMGHVTLLDSDVENAVTRARALQPQIQIIT